MALHFTSPLRLSFTPFSNSPSAIKVKTECIMIDLFIKMKGTSTESVGSCGSFLQPRRLLYQDGQDQSPQIAPAQMNNPFSSPPQQEGHFRNTASDSLSRGAVSTPSDRTVIPVAIVQNAHGVARSPSFSPWQDGNFNTNDPIRQPTQVGSSENAPEAGKASHSSEGHNGNKCLMSGAGGSGPSDRQALVTLMMDGYELPEILCPCGAGPCIVLTSHTQKNPNRRFYKCPANIKCKFFKWCDNLGQSSQSPSKPTQGCIRSPQKMIEPQNTPLEPICSCNAGPCIVRTMHEGEHKGRKYYACAIQKGQGACNHFEWVDNPVKPPETESNSNANQYLLIADVTTPEPKQTFSTFAWVNNPVKPLGTGNSSYRNQNNLSIDAVTTETKRRTLSPFESVKDLFGENDMKTIEYWCKDQNDPNSTAAIEYERSKELSPGKRQPPPNTVGEISPMKKLNLSEAIPVVENCPMCGAIGQCIECPILACFKNDDFAENKHENAMNGGGISNLINISPIGGTMVQNATPGSSKRSGKCFNCGKEGHWRSECTSPLGINFPCFKCGKIGHWMKNCNM